MLETPSASMMPDHPFHPPADRDDAEVSSSRAALSVILTWALSGACAGTAVGATMRLLGAAGASPGIVGAVAILAFGLTGALALRFERQGASGRPEVLDARGRRGRPLHGALYVLPVAIAVPMLLWLVVVGSVAASSMLPAFGFGMLALAMAWGGAKAWSGHRMARALEAFELGRLDEARGAFEGLAASPLASANARVSARLALGSVALQSGDLDAAARWFGQVRGGPAGAFASAGMALVHVLRDQLDAAEEEVQAAMASPSGRLVQEQVDTVRLVLVWRREGPEEARAFGERMLSDASGPIFRGALAELRALAGDADGAEALRRDLGGLGGGIVDLLPELKAR